ncbi:hypothetical protein [Fontivita pretiosa]|uniref:ankyrin repeat domain-containing protein n=1 Tax=Fontivita pretiosa TaxID=2989684 RepID=UPI003D17400F
MSSSPAPRKRLPVNPSIEHLKKRAKRLAAREPSLKLADAQHRLAREYGCRNWAELAHVVETMSRGATQIFDVKAKLEPLPEAANRNDLDAVRHILAHERLTQHDLDKALARAVLRFGQRRQIAQLLIEHGADPDGQYGSNYGPIVLVTAECIDPDGLQFLIDHGADITFAPVQTKYGRASPMLGIISTYERGKNELKRRYIDLLLAHGAHVPLELTGEFLAIHRGDVDALGREIDRDPAMVERRFGSIPGGGNVDLAGATLLHMAVEFGQIACVDLLVSRGADLNARAQVIQGIGGQTPIFHAIATNQQRGLPMLEHLVGRYGGSIDMSVRATFRLYGEPFATPVTPLEYAQSGMRNDTPSWRRTSPRELELLAGLTPH